MRRGAAFARRGEDATGKRGPKPRGDKGKLTTRAAMARGAKQTRAREEAAALVEAATKKRAGNAKRQAAFKERKRAQKSAIVSEILAGCGLDAPSSARVEGIAKTGVVLTDASALLQAALATVSRVDLRVEDRVMIARELRGIARETRAVAELQQQQAPVLPERIVFVFDLPGAEVVPLTTGDALETA